MSGTYVNRNGKSLIYDAHLKVLGYTTTVAEPLKISVCMRKVAIRTSCSTADQRNQAGGFSLV